MISQEHGTGILHDAVQQIITSLRQSGDQIALIITETDGHSERLVEGMSGIEDQLANQRATLLHVTEQEQEARSAYEALLAVSPIRTLEVQSAVARLIDATVAQTVAREWVRHLQGERTICQQRMRLTTEKLEHLQGLYKLVVHSVDLLISKFNSLSLTLETAQQGRALGLHVIRAQEEERRRLAREIHDGPTQLLNSVVLRIVVCERLYDADPPRVREELTQLKDLVRLSIQEMRKLIFDLRPMTLDDLGLIPALRAYLKDYQAKTGLETDLRVTGPDRRFDSAFEVAIFRLVQEALTNVDKHSGAGFVFVEVLQPIAGSLRVRVVDDGEGFAPDQVRRETMGTKFGLVAMRERTELLGGEMEIVSAPGSGSTLSFVFPPSL